MWCICQVTSKSRQCSDTCWLCCRQLYALQQKVADAEDLAAQQQQAQQQSYTQTLALLDQTHLQQLSKLRTQLQGQALTHEAAAAKLKLELSQRNESQRQLQDEVKQLQQQCKILDQSCATEKALVKSLMKQAASARDTAIRSSNDGKPDSSTTGRNLESKFADEADTAQAQSANGTAASSSQSVSISAVNDSAAMAYTTLSLKADVLQKEAGILKDKLSATEAANQKLIQVQCQEKQQHASQLKLLDQTICQLQEKHVAAAAVVQETVAAVTSRTSLLLLQRQTGVVVFFWK